MKETIKMSVGFNDAEGSAKKVGLDYLKLSLGQNKVRLVGGLLPRYAYWKMLKTNTIPVECLSFDRKEERFLNAEKDWFKHHFPKNEKDEDMRCVWSYVIQAIDLKDGKLKLFGLKKKLFDQIQDAGRKHLGDPTDPVKGWDVIFDKKSTGSNVFNVEYTLDVMACKNRALNADELAIIKDMKSIDELIPRPTAEQQKLFIETAWIEGEKPESNVDKQALLDFDEDIPF